MSMFSHIMVGSNDIQVSKKFYDATLGALGYPPGMIDDKNHCLYITPAGVFAASIPINGAPASYANGGTIGFAAKSIAEVDAWHKAGIENGGTTCEDPPGFRMEVYYLAYLRDPFGNKLCAMYHKQ